MVNDMMIPTSLNEKALAEKSVAHLAKVYNAMASELGKKELKKFRDKKTAVERVLKLHAEYTKTMHVEPEKKPVKTSKRQIKEKGLTKEGAKKPRGSIKQLTITLISESKEDKEIVEAVQNQYPDSKFDFSHVSWYRSTLFRDGIIGPEHAPRRTSAYKNWKKAQK